MGAYVSLAASERVNAKAVFLLAPALYIPGYRHQVFSTDHPHIEIVHGWSDDIIPPEHSIKFAKEADCTLHLISGDHRLTGPIELVEELFRRFLQRVLAE
jgi:predicted esterase